MSREYSFADMVDFFKGEIWAQKDLIEKHQKKRRQERYPDHWFEAEELRLRKYKQAYSDYLNAVKRVEK